jgi:hypothetical protein
MHEHALSHDSLHGENRHPARTHPTGTTEPLFGAFFTKPKDTFLSHEQSARIITVNCNNNKHRVV